MGKTTFIAMIALLIAVAGAIVAFAAYFKRRSQCTLCDDFDEDMSEGGMDDLDYYATQLDQEELDDDETADAAPASQQEETAGEEESEA